MPSILPNAKNANIIKQCIIRIQQHIQTLHGKDKELSFVHPHVIDLADDGHIGPHVDSIKFSGKLICGLSLKSARILRLLHTCVPMVSNSVSNSANITTDGIKNTNKTSSSTNNNVAVKYIQSTQYTDDFVDYSANKEVFRRNILDENYPLVEVELKPRSLYIISNLFRYQYSHEIIGKYSTYPPLLITRNGHSNCEMNSHANIISPLSVNPIGDSEKENYDRRISIMIRDNL